MTNTPEQVGASEHQGRTLPAIAGCLLVDTGLLASVGER